jgi:hypothetical protein
MGLILCFFYSPLPPVVLMIRPRCSAMAAVFAGDIDRELADASVARPRAIRKRSGERDGSRLLDFGYDHKLPPTEPLSNCAVERGSVSNVAIRSAMPMAE